jgi:protein CpxP
MTNTETTPTGPSNDAGDRGGRCRGRGRGRKLAFVGAIAGAMLVGSLATKAFSHGPGWGHHAGFMGGGFADPIDPVRVDDRIDRGIKHFAVEADATPEQTKKIADIAKAAVHDLLPLREKAQGVRKQLADLMTQPAIDRTQLEKLRAEQMANAETLTKRMTQALADAGDVLSPEQRKKVAERMAEHRAGWFRR